MSIREMTQAIYRQAQPDIERRSDGVSGSGAAFRPAGFTVNCPIISSD
jgi:hypothetical protein